jgi:hypothetical protein
MDDRRRRPAVEQVLSVVGQVLAPNDPLVRDHDFDELLQAIDRAEQSRLDEASGVLINPQGARETISHRQGE